MNTLRRYVLKSHVTPALAGLALFYFVLSMDFIVDYLSLFITKGVPGAAVLEAFLLSLAWMTLLAVPMAVMVAVLTAFGRLSQDNEITAAKATGVNIFSLVAPVLIAAALLTAGLFQFGNRVLPASNFRLKKLLVGEISRKNVGGPIEIARQSHSALQAGWDVFLRLLVLISINVGILNLLPIPILDGGQALVVAVEGVKRSPLSLRTREAVQQVGLVNLAFAGGLDAGYVNWANSTRHVLIITRNRGYVKGYFPLLLATYRTIFSFVSASNYEGELLSKNLAVEVKKGLQRKVERLSSPYLL